MKQQLQGGIQNRQNDQQSCVRPWGGVFVLLEVVVAVTVIVGAFAAASQPLNWASAVQFLLCAALGSLLWLADARLAADESVAAEHVDVFAYHHAVVPEARSSQR